MAECVLNERQLRERDYYEEYARRYPVRVASLTAISGSEARPWNPYWALADIVRLHYQRPGQRLFDLGCGPGRYAVQFAYLGYDVFGLDVSPANVDAAASLAAQHDLSDRTHFDVGTAEALPYPDAHFDIITGIDVLHHVDIQATLSECLRVLKPGGIAVFKEPIAVPVFDALRQSWFGRAIRPADASFERHITADERKLTSGDLVRMRAMCDVSEHRFRVMSRLDALLGGLMISKTSGSALERLDRQLLRLCPGAGALGGNVVLVCRHKSRRPDAHDVPAA